MRRWVIVVLAVAGLIVAVFGYAFFNLGALIEANRGYLLARASDTLGRPVKVAEVKAHFGWSLAIDLRDVRIADDPAFSLTSLPPADFLQAKDVYAEVNLLPLLGRSLEIRRVRIVEPTVRLIRNRAGQFNVSSLGASRESAEKVRHDVPQPAAEPAKPAAAGPGSQLQLTAPSARPPGAGALTIANLAIANGSLSYVDQQESEAPLNIQGVTLAVDGFRPDAPFHVSAALAVLSEQPNLKVDGTAGPLISGAAFVLDQVPVALTAMIGPIALDRLRTVPALTGLLPAGLAIAAPVTLAAKLTGTIGALQLDARSDLSASHVVYAGIIDKAAGVPLTVGTTAVRAAGKVALRRVDLALAGQTLAVTDIAFGANRVSAHLDSDSANLAQLAAVVIPMRDYHPGGALNAHVTVTLTAGEPTATGALVLTDVGATIPGGKVPPLAGLTGPIALAGKSARVGPVTGTIGSSKGGFTCDVASFMPLRVAYQLTLDTLKPGEFQPERQPLGEQMNGIVAQGELSRDASGPTASTRLTSTAGTLARVAYQNLALNGSWAGDQIAIESFKAAAFDGSLDATGSATLGAVPSFDLKLDVRAIDLRNALESQKARAAATVRGRLTGTLQVYGSGARLEQITPTLRGAGRATVANGKLVGVNVVAQALGKLNNLPGIGALVPSEVASRHPELFKSPDTAIDQASLSFTLQGPRLTSHDINVRTPDYVILGDGWFDMDKQVDLAARILLAPAFSGELASARRNVAYLENGDRQVEIPLRIVGELPHPRVIPDVGVLVQRGTTNVFERQLHKLLGGSSGGSGGGSPARSNPLDQLKQLFH